MSGNEFVGSSAGFADGVVDLAGDVAFDASHDLVFGFGFGSAHPAHRHAPLLPVVAAATSPSVGYRCSSGWRCDYWKVDDWRLLRR